MLKSYYKKQSKSNKAAKSEFKYNAMRIAHDLQAPLMVLRFVKPFLKVLPVDLRSTFLGAINRIQELASELSEYFFDTNSFNSQIPVLVDLDRVLKEKININEQSKVTIDGSAEGCASQVVLSSYRMRSCFYNLINNAREASSIGSKIRIRLDYLNASKLRVCVQDSGKGVLPKLLPKLSSRKINSSEKTGKGKGMALWLLGKDLRSKGGELQFVSSVSHGTKVNLLIRKKNNVSSCLRVLDFLGKNVFVTLSRDIALHEFIKSKVLNLSQHGCLHSAHFLDENEALDFCLNLKNQRKIQVFMDFDSYKNLPESNRLPNDSIVFYQSNESISDVLNVKNSNYRFVLRSNFFKLLN